MISASLSFRRRIDRGDVSIGELLDLFLPPRSSSSAIIFSLSSSLRSLRASRRTLRNPTRAVLGVRAHDLDEVAAPLLGHRRQRHADHLPAVTGFKPSPELMMAFSTAETMFFSHGVHDERPCILDGDVGGLLDGTPCRSTRP